MESKSVIESSRKSQFNSFLRLLKNTAKKESVFHTLDSSKKRIALMANLFRKAFRKDSIVVWRNLFFPTELLFALDLVPFSAESAMSMFANAGLGTKLLNLAENNFYSRDICSFSRGIYGAVVEDCLPTPDFIVCTSLYCDGSAKLFYNLSRELCKDFFYIDVPYHHNRDYALKYVTSQLENTVKRICRILGKEIDPGKLSEVVNYSNQARDYFVKINKLRQTIPAPILGGEAIDHAIMLSHLWGAKETVEVYKTLYEELKERIEKSIPAINGGEKYRILWRNLRTYFDDSLMRYLEIENKAVIAFEEINFVHWQPLDPKEPYKSIAKKLLSNPPLGEFQRWLNCTLKFIEDYSIDGVIEYAHWGCHYINSRAQILKDVLKERNIPLLIIDGDYIDSRDYSDGQVKTRIDAFLEILERRREQK